MITASTELKALLDVADRLRETGEASASQRRDDGGWSKKEILGHLIDSAANNHQRFVRMQQQELLEFPGYDQPNWVRLQAYQDRSWAELIALWVALNQHLAHVIERLEPRALENRWHSPDGEQTLRFVAEDYLVHLRHHLRQLGIEA